MGTESRQRPCRNREPLRSTAELASPSPWRWASSSWPTEADPHRSRHPSRSRHRPSPPRLGRAAAIGRHPTPVRRHGQAPGQLGSGFAYTRIPLEALEDVSKLVDYDVVFFTCGTDAPDWLTNTNLGEGDRPGVHIAKWNEDVLERIREALRAYVGRGGTLYASDWRLNLIHLLLSRAVRR